MSHLSLSRSRRADAVTEKEKRLSRAEAQKDSATRYWQALAATGLVGATGLGLGWGIDAMNVRNKIQRERAKYNKGYEVFIADAKQMNETADVRSFPQAYVTASDQMHTNTAKDAPVPMNAVVPLANEYMYMASVPICLFHAAHEAIDELFPRLPPTDIEILQEVANRKLGVRAIISRLNLNNWVEFSLQPAKISLLQAYVLLSQRSADERWDPRPLGVRLELSAGYGAPRTDGCGAVVMLAFQIANILRSVTWYTWNPTSKQCSQQHIPYAMDREPSVLMLDTQCSDQIIDCIDTTKSWTLHGVVCIESGNRAVAVYRTQSDKWYVSQSTLVTYDRQFQSPTAFIEEFAGRVKVILQIYVSKRCSFKTSPQQQP